MKKNHSSKKLFLRKKYRRQNQDGDNRRQTTGTPKGRFPSERKFSHGRLENIVRMIRCKITSLSLCRLCRALCERDSDCIRLNKDGIHYCTDKNHSV